MGISGSTSIVLTFDKAETTLKNEAIQAAVPSEFNNLCPFKPGSSLFVTADKLYVVESPSLGRENGDQKGWVISAPKEANTPRQWIYLHGMRYHSGYESGHVFVHDQRLLLLTLGTEVDRRINLDLVDLSASQDQILLQNLNWQDRTRKIQVTPGSLGDVGFDVVYVSGASLGPVYRFPSVSFILPRSYNSFNRIISSYTTFDLQKVVIKPVITPTIPPREKKSK